MNEEDNKTLEYFKKVYDELIQDEKYQKYASLMDFYHKKIEDLQHQIEEKDKNIDEAIELTKKWKTSTACELDDYKFGIDLLEILERGNK